MTSQFHLITLENKMIIIELIKNLLRKILKIIKKFPITCYGAFSVLTYSGLHIFSITYDYGLIALIPIFIGAPFIFMVTSVEKFLFPEYFLHSATSKLSLELMIIELCVVIFVTLILDYFIIFIIRALTSKATKSHH